MSLINFWPRSVATLQVPPIYFGQPRDGHTQQNNARTISPPRSRTRSAIGSRQRLPPKLSILILLSGPMQSEKYFAYFVHHFSLPSERAEWPRGTMTLT